MKTSRIILFVCSLEVLISAFVNIPYLSTSLFRIIALIVAYAMIKLSAYLWERKIEKLNSNSKIGISDHPRTDKRYRNLCNLTKK
ncbi:MAG: hypothetical protein K5895_10675 [Lachnospiraceae bacterium]|nr:hypothetical protein [Lachnospiraceae bacterium]